MRQDADPDGPPPSFGELLRRYRSRSGLTQQELATRSGVSVRAVGDAEHDRVRHPRIRSVLALSTALGLSDAECDALCRAAQAAPRAGHDRGTRIGVLGPLSVRRDGVAVDVGSRMERRLLGLLAVQPGQVVAPDEMIEVLWSTAPPKTCLNLVHVYVGRLRRLLADTAGRRTGFRVLVRAGGGYRLDLDDTRLDLLHFDELVRQARTAAGDDRSQTAEDLLATALDRWRGPVLGGTEPALAQHPAVVRAAARRVDAALLYAGLAAAAGHHDAAAARLRAVAADEPLHEGLHTGLILALAAGGQQAAALRIFGEIRDRLGEELGIGPGTALSAAHLRILRQDVPEPAGPGRPPAAGDQPVAAAVVPAQLPLAATAFTGREADLARLDALVADHPDGAPPRQGVTVAAIDGTAGVGKTTLAVHWAHRVRDRFPDGQFYVDLRGFAAGAPVSPVDALAGFLRGLGVPEERIPVQVDEAAALFRSVVADRRVLVVLDNAVDAAQVRPLFPAGPGCLVLVTSRSRLTGLVARDGATRVGLGVLPAGEAGALVTRLLGAERTAREPGAVADLARACAHLPLALRIAAANLLDRPDLGIGAYVADLVAGDRLAALEVDGDAEAAVRTTFDLSYARLDPPARVLFRRIGLLAGPDLTAETAAVLTGATTAEAQRLLDRLLAVHLLDQPAPGRYGCHDLLRLYAAARAADDPAAGREAALRRLHDHYLHAVGAAADRLFSMARLPVPAPAGPRPDVRFPDAGRAIAWLDAERRNLLATVGHTAVHGPPAVAWRLTDALRGYLYQGMYAVDWLAALDAARVAADADGDPLAQASVELGYGTYHWSQSHFRRAVDHHLRVVHLARRAGWADGEASALGNLGGLYQVVGELERSVEHYTAAMAVRGGTDRPAQRANHLTNLGIVRHELGQLRQAADHHEQARAIFSRIGSAGGEATALGNLGSTWHLMGRLDDARDVLDRALVLHREVGDRSRHSQVLMCLAELHADRGDLDRAADLARTALALAEDTGRGADLSRALAVLALVHHRLGQYGPALDRNRQSVRLTRDIDSTQHEAAALIGLADTLRDLGDTAPALAHARHAVRLARLRGYRVFEADALTAVATTHHRAGERAAAVDHARHALARYRRSDHRLGEARAHLLLGAALGDAEQARDHGRKAAALFAGIGVPADGEARRMLGGPPPAAG